MRPNVSEQLSGMRRVLEDVVAPELASSYPLDILDGIMSTLDALAASWMDVPAFLQWDGEETARILRDGGIEVHSPPDASLDLRALETWHAEVRWTLQQHVPEILDGPLAGELTSHLKRRAERFPVRPETRMPGQR